MGILKIRNGIAAAAGAVAALLLGACAGTSGRLQPQSGPAATLATVPHLLPFQPLTIGNAWVYSCRDIKGGGENNGNPFTFTDRVLRRITVAHRQLIEFELHVPIVPSKPLKVVTELMLLANNKNGDLWIYGYILHGKPALVKPAEIVSAAIPSRGKLFNYPGPGGKRVQRFFFGYIPTNPTPLGTFTVADYEESNATNDYGYAYGKGIMEEDHGPNFEVDCLIQKIVRS